MKASKMDKLFIVLMVVGVFLIAYGAYAGATTAVSITRDGIEFLGNQITGFSF